MSVYWKDTPGSGISGCDTANRAQEGALARVSLGRLLVRRDLRIERRHPEHVFQRHAGKTSPLLVAREERRRKHVGHRRLRAWQQLRVDRDTHQGGRDALGRGHDVVRVVAVEA